MAAMEELLIMLLIMLKRINFNLKVIINIPLVKEIFLGLFHLENLTNSKLLVKSLTG
jgi:hypothetical protein